jgi:hypothetical protein
LAAIGGKRQIAAMLAPEFEDLFRAQINGH